MKMSIEDKIDLEGIINNYWYLRMALLVDKLEFIENVYKARESLKIDKPIIYSEAKEWLSRESKEDAVRLQWKLTVEIGSLIEKFKLNHHDYFMPIRSAILTGKITEKELYSDPICESYPFSQEFDEAELFLEKPTVAIFVHPETKIEEVESVMRGKVRELFKQTEKHKQFKGNIIKFKNAREWYWLKKQMTYDKLYEHINRLGDPNKPISYEKIKRAVERYSKRLKSDK